WARLLGRVFGLEMRPCPLCRRGSLHLMAVITQESVITRILRHLQLASVPPPMAPARCRPELCVFDSAHARVVLSATCAPRRPRASLCAWAGPCALRPPRLPAVPRRSPPGYPEDAPRTAPARCPAGAGSCIQRRCSVQAAGFRGCAPRDTRAKIPFDLPIRPKFPSLWALLSTSLPPSPAPGLSRKRP